MKVTYERTDLNLLFVWHGKAIVDVYTTQCGMFDESDVPVTAFSVFDLPTETLTVTNSAELVAACDAWIAQLGPEAVTGPVGASLEPS